MAGTMGETARIGETLAFLAHNGRFVLWDAQVELHSSVPHGVAAEWLPEGERVELVRYKKEKITGVRRWVSGTEKMRDERRKVEDRAREILDKMGLMDCNSKPALELTAREVAPLADELELIP